VSLLLLLLFGIRVVLWYPLALFFAHRPSIAHLHRHPCSTMFFDEYGRPFIVLRQEANGTTERAKGIDAIKVCVVMMQATPHHLCCLAQSRAAISSDDIDWYCMVSM
jgi:hypothetical protein